MTANAPLPCRLADSCHAMNKMGFKQKRGRPVLTIGPQALEALSEAARRSFEDRMGPHVRECFPDRCASISDQQLRDFIRAATDRAFGYDIVRECDVARFVYLMIAVNDQFDNDPQMPWVKPLLLDRQQTADARLEAIYRKLLDLSGVRSFTGDQI